VEEKDMSRALRHRAGEIGEIGEDVDTYLRNAKITLRKELRLAIKSIMDATPSPGDGEIGVFPSDIVDEVLGALLDFTDCDTIVESILKNESLTTDLHERMTRDI